MLENILERITACLAGVTLLSLGSVVNAETIPLPRPFPVGNDQVVIDAFKISANKATERHLYLARTLHVSLACRSWARLLDQMAKTRISLARASVHKSEKIVESTRALVRLNPQGSAARVRHEAELAEHQNALEKAKAQLEAARADHSDERRRLNAVNTLLASSAFAIQEEFPEQARLGTTPDLDAVDELHKAWLEALAEPPKCEKSYLPTIEWVEARIEATK